MAGLNTSAPIQFFIVEGATHFSILAPANRLIAQKILRDDGPATNIHFTDEEIRALKPGNKNDQ